MRAPRAVLLALLCLAPGCMSFRSTEGKTERLSSADADERFENLLSLAEDAENDPALAADLCERALRIADDDPSVPVRLVALRVLGKLGKQGVRTKDVALKLSNHASKKSDPDFWCRIESLDALGNLVEGPQNTLPDESVRAQAHEAIREALRADLEPDRDVRIHAARELALLRPDTGPVLGALVAALSDEAADVRYHAQRALVAIAGADHGPTKADWAMWVSRHHPDESPK